MRRTAGALAVVMCVVATGCPDRFTGLPIAFGPEGSRTRSQSIPLGDLTAPEAAGMDVRSVLLERPIGDSFLDDELWAARGAVLSHDREVILAENGLRVRLFGGTLPPKLQTLLGSATDTVNPHRLTFANRQEDVIPTSGPSDVCEYQLLPGLSGQRTKVTLRNARCGIMVRPERIADGRVKLWCEPQVQHGEKIERWHPTSDATGFVMERAVPLERYPGIGFDIVLAANEYLIIGWPASAEGTLGAALFAVEAGGQPRQRVLLIQAAAPGERPTDPSASRAPRSRPPIAAEVAKW